MSTETKLTSHTKFSGCGAKLPPDILGKALCGLEQPLYEKLDKDFTKNEDCGVYNISKDISLVQTVDFFPQIVDDPFLFGRIAACNALSDIYAMGGTPITALAIVCYPLEKLGKKSLEEMLKGGLNALIEANCALLGGHSIEDIEPKLGYSITGQLKKSNQWNNNSIEENCAIILTKPLGTGIINTAHKAGIAEKEDVNKATNSMQTLNKKACEILQNYEVKACTDVTGFGLLGHCAEMVCDSSFGVEMTYNDIPVISQNIKDYAKMGLVPAGAWKNKNARAKFVSNLNDIAPINQDILFDPQTSGGLLVCIESKEAKKAEEELNKNNIEAKIIGKTNKNSQKITIK